MTKTLRNLSASILVLLLIAACGGGAPPADVPTTEDELISRINDDVDAFSGLTATALNQSATAASLVQLPSGLPVRFPTLLGGFSADTAGISSSGLSTLQDATLLRGSFTYDPNTGNWNEASSDNLVLAWPFQSPNGSSNTAELTVDWEDGSSIVIVDDGFETLEMPTSMSITHLVNSSQVLDFSLDGAWYNTSSCGASGGIFEPTRLDINGSITEAGNRLSLDIGVVNSGSDIGTDGDITATVGSDTASITWDVSASGQRQRDSDCFTEEFEVDSGSIDVGASSNVGGQSSSVGFEVDFDNIVITNGEPESVDLSNGRISVDGQTAASFSGTLDDSNDNGIPGENVTVTVGSDSVTLEELLMGVEMASTALRALSAF